MEPNENKFSRENMNEFIDEKLNPEDSSFDDFDLEALEGLKMAGKIENDLFNRIDSKIDQEVVRRSKKRIGIVWMSIAACLALAIGFYFWSTLNLSQIETQKQFAEINENDSHKVTEKIPELTSAENMKRENELKEDKFEPPLIKNDDQPVKPLQAEEDIATAGNTAEVFASDQEQQMDELAVVEDKNLDLNNTSVAAQASVPQNSEGKTKSLELQKKDKSKKNSNKTEEQAPSVATRNENVAVASGLVMADSITLNEVSISNSITNIATYPGGQMSLLKFYRQQIAPSTLNLLSGKTVSISVFVNSHGKAIKPKILQGVPACNEELIRVSKLMASWNPAIHNGKPFGKRISFTLSF